jgi:hypothetical protein
MDREALSAKNDWFIWFVWFISFIWVKHSNQRN